MVKLLTERDRESVNHVIASLEEIAQLARVSRSPEDLKKAIQSAREAIQLSFRGGEAPEKSRGVSATTGSLGRSGDLEMTEGASRPEMTLDKELSTWQSKLDVIWKEPIARQGMGKHAEYWVERLKKESALNR